MAPLVEVDNVLPQSAVGLSLFRNIMLGIGCIDEVGLVETVPYASGSHLCPGRPTVPNTVKLKRGKLVAGRSTAMSKRTTVLHLYDALKAHIMHKSSGCAFKGVLGSRKSSRCHRRHLHVLHQTVVEQEEHMPALSLHVGVKLAQPL